MERGSSTVYESVIESSGDAPRASFETALEHFVGLGDADLDATIRELERARRGVEARLAGAVAVAEQRRLHLMDGHRSMKGYLRATCNWPSAEAGRWRSIATGVNWMPEVGDAWLAGRIGHAQVAEFGRVFGNRRVSAQLREFAPLLLADAERLPFDDFLLCVQQFVADADADGAHVDRDTAVTHRRAHAIVNGSELDVAAVGGDAITATEYVNILRSFEQHEFHADVAARAAEFGADADGLDLPRTAPQRRFDAMIAMARAAAAHGVGDGAPAVGVVNVVIDLATFRRMLAESGLAPHTSELQGELAELLDERDGLLNRRCETSDGAPVHPHDVLRMLLDGYVRRVVINAAGVVPDMGRKARLFSGPAREAAQLLVRRCEHPGCDLPADLCEVDHNLEWADGGATDQSNSNMLCGHHNRWKNRRRWQSKRATDGRCYTVRADGTVVLPVGAPEPEFEDPVEIRRQIHLARERARALALPGST